MKTITIKTLLSFWILLISSVGAQAEVPMHEGLKRDLVGLDYLIRNLEFSIIKCDLGTCQFSTADASYTVQLRRATPVEFKREGLIYVMRVSARSPLMASTLNIDYIQDPPSIVLGRGGWSEPLPAYEKLYFRMVGRWVPILQSRLMRRGLSID